MCTFMNTLPRHSKSVGDKKRNLLVSLRPCKDENGQKTWYRFMLLAFQNASSTRDYPWIERYVHQHWGKNEKGYNMIDDQVVCPVTKWVDWEGDRYDGCPVCKVANQYFLTFKESGWKDKDSCKKNKEYGRKFEGIIPVFVVNDPNYAGNNNKFKVIILNDKKFYAEFKSKVDAMTRTVPVFNGKAAVDCCFHVAEVEEVRNQGQPNEYKYKTRSIDKIVFTNKPYDIPAITKEAVDGMGFDDQYYTASTKDELKMFYDKHIKVSNSDIPDSDNADMVFEAKPEAKAAPAAKADMPVDNKPVVTKVENPAAKAEPSDPDDLNDILASVDDAKSTKASSPAAASASQKPAIKKDDPESTTDASVDELLKD